MLRLPRRGPPAPLQQAHREVHACAGGARLQQLAEHVHIAAGRAQGDADCGAAARGPAALRIRAGGPSGGGGAARERPGVPCMHSRLVLVKLGPVGTVSRTCFRSSLWKVCVLALVKRRPVIVAQALLTGRCGGASCAAAGWDGGRGGAGAGWMVGGAWRHRFEQPIPKQQRPEQAQQGASPLLMVGGRREGHRHHSTGCAWPGSSRQSGGRRVKHANMRQLAALLAIWRAPPGAHRSAAAGTMAAQRFHSLVLVIIRHAPTWGILNIIGQSGDTHSAHRGEAAQLCVIQ